MWEQLGDLYATYQSTFGYIGINALLALSVYTTLSCGQLALGNAGFMALGGYAAALLTVNAHRSFVLALAAALLVAMAAGLSMIWFGRLG